MNCLQITFWVLVLVGNLLNLFLWLPRCSFSHLIRSFLCTVSMYGKKRGAGGGHAARRGQRGDLCSGLGLLLLPGVCLSGSASACSSHSSAASPPRWYLFYLFLVED